jgi:hypothetical protein
MSLLGEQAVKFDHNTNEITLDQMKRWQIEWKDSIRKMWDEQKGIKAT